MAEEMNDTDEFDKAFNEPEGTAPEATPEQELDPTPEPEQQPSAEAEPEPEQQPEPTPEAADKQQPQAEPESPKQEKPQDSGEVLDPVEKQREQSWQGRLRAHEQRLLEREAQLREMEEKLSQQKEEAPKEAAPEAVPLERWQAMQEEYPDIAQGVDEVINARVAEAVKQARAAMEEQTAPIIQGQQALSHEQQEMAAREHFVRIESAHPDYRNIAQGGDLEAFVNEQPAFVADAMRNVIQQGNTDQVIDLFDTYKRARGLTNQPSQTPTETAPKKSVEDAPTAVPSRSGGMPSTKVPAEDFDGAFEEALKSDN